MTSDMYKLSVFLHSSVGVKCVMALSGLLMVGFLVGHMAGNLLVFLGPQALNSYAASLHSMPVLLWSTRIALLVAVIAHVITAVILTRRNRRARASSHTSKHSGPQSTWTSRHMALTGTLILGYVLYHLAHFTWKWTHPQFAQSPENVYGMIVQSFQNLWVSGTYIIAMAVLGLHLYHGIRSSFDSLGFYHPTYTPIIRKAAATLSVVLALGFSSIPVAVLAGWLH